MNINVKIWLTAVLYMWGFAFIAYGGSVSSYENNFNETWISEFGAKGYIDGSYIRGEYDSPRGSAVDFSGNVILVGMTEGNLTGETTEQKYCGFIAKIDIDGKRTWTNQCKIGNIEYAHLVDVAVDEQNNIYVTGPYNNNVLVMKLDKNANLIWSKQFGRNDASEEPKALYRASNGNIYITGTVRPDDYTEPEQVFVTLVTPNGQSASTREFGSDREDMPVDVQTDSHGNIYVAGYTDGDFDGQVNSGSQDIFLTKFDTAGTKLWSKLFGSESAPEHQLKSDLARAMTIASNDVIYIAGDTQGNLGGKQNSGNYDMFVTKFSTDGLNLGTIMQGGANLNNPNYGAADHVGDITVTSDGSIYLFGTTTGQFPDSGNNGNDYAQLILVKFNQNGTYAWAHQYGPCCENKDNEAVSIQKDSADNLYLLARANQYFTAYYPTRFPEIAAFKLTEVNTTKFSRFAENIFSSLDARSAVEGHGNIIVSGAESGLDAYVKEFSFDVSLTGPLSAYNTYGKYAPASNHPLTIDPDDNTYSISFSNEDIEGEEGNGYDSTVVTKYGSDGSILWIKRFNSTGGNNIPTSIAYYNDNLYLCGYTEGNIDGGNDNNGSDSKYGVHRVDGFVMSLDAATGTKRWVDQFSEGNTDIVFMRDLKIDSRGYLHAIGGNQNAIVVNTYQLDGHIVSFEQYGSNISVLGNMGLAVNNTSLYIVGSVSDRSGDIFIAKIDKSAPADGELVWKKQQGTDSYDEGDAIAIGQDGNLYIVGFTSGDLDGDNMGGTDMILESYSPNGVLLASRQMGTQSDDRAYGIFVDSAGGLVVSGRTNDSAVIQRYTVQKSNVLENTPLVLCINEILGMDPHHIPTLEEMESIDYLSCNNKKVLSAAGIEYLPNLRHLDLGHNLISDLSPLSDLLKLDYLNIAHNKISDITPIEDLKTLTYLHLTGNMITDISTLASFTGLETLTIGENRIEDISALRNMLQLRFLSIEKNKISDISVIRYLTSLEILYLGGNYITDFSPIPSSVEVHGKDHQNVQSTSIAAVINYLLN